MMNTIRILLFAVFLSLTACRLVQAQDPLPSWNEGAAKSAILKFVENAANQTNPDFVPAAERIAVFDNDGTLWPENPLPFQAMFILDELRKRLPDHPEWNDNPLVKSAVEGRTDLIVEAGMKGLAELLDLTHSGMTIDEFENRVREWLKASEHPRYHRPYDKLAYQPMLELLDYLRAKGFKVYIVSGGGQDFMRVWAEQVYGIPPENVIGSYSATRYLLKDGVPTLMKRPGVEFVDDKAGKPVAIDRFLGRKPIACFGNSDGDKAMLEWTTIGRTNTLGVIVRHTDAEREYAYDASPKSTGKLVEALAEAPERGWIVIDMKQDWNRIYSFD